MCQDEISRYADSGTDTVGMEPVASADGPPGGVLVDSALAGSDLASPLEVQRYSDDLDKLYIKLVDWADGFDQSYSRRLDELGLPPAFLPVDADVDTDDPNWQPVSNPQLTKAELAMIRKVMDEVAAEYLALAKD